jgi:hypothetical protein
MLRRLFHRRRIVPAPSDLAALAAVPCPPWAGSGLHSCPGCRASFVCPVQWRLVSGGDEVWMLLRCGQCQTWREVTVPTRVAERFSADFELAQSQIRAALGDLERERMAEGR